MRSLLAFILTIAFLSCSNNAEQEAIRYSDSIATHDSTMIALQNAKVTRLQELRDSLVRASFGTDIDGDYVHIHWSNTLNAKENGFGIIVTSPKGAFYYLSKAKSDDRHVREHTSLRISCPDGADAVYQHADFKDWPLTIAHTEGCDHVLFYDYAGKSLAGYIFQHKHQELTACTMHDEEKSVSYTLSAEDKQAVADCILLSRVLEELYAVSY